MFEALKNLFSSDDEKKSPEGVCPNCWGKQEYGGKFYEAVKNKNVNINNFEKNKGWIMDYYERNLHHIELIKDRNNEDTLCQNCKITYKK